MAIVKEQEERQLKLAKQKQRDGFSPLCDSGIDPTGQNAQDQLQLGDKREKAIGEKH